MANILTRVKQKIFGETGGTSQFAQFGSESAGTPVKTKNLATIQALTQFSNGLFAATDNAGQPPFIEDVNSLFLLTTTQLAYLYQNGIPEYDADTDYFNLISFVQVNGVLYQSIDGDGTTPNTGNAPASSPTKWRLADPYLVAQKESEERIHAVGTITPYLGHRAPVVWDPSSRASAKSYHAAINLSAIADYQVIDSTGTSSGLNLQPITKLVSPSAVTWLRAQKATVRLGMATEKSAFTGSTWAITGGTTCTLVFASDSDLVAILASLNEDAAVAGASADLLTYPPDYTKSWLLNVPVNLSTGGSLVPAGDYVLISNTSGTRTVQFTVPATTNVGPTPTSVQFTFHPFRLAGQPGKARIFASQGRVLQGANDSLIENVIGGRRRGRVHDHRHFQEVHAYSAVGGANTYRVALGTNIDNGAIGPTMGPSDNGQGDVRTGPETDVRATIANFEFGLGALEA